ncbi:hypothetical protein C0J52_12703 [Blattella germanica]|nr:hypothetical protein C0J52_12703 [Blattella germanica]
MIYNICILSVILVQVLIPESTSISRTITRQETSSSDTHVAPLVTESSSDNSLQQYSNSLMGENNKNRTFLTESSEYKFNKSIPLQLSGITQDLRNILSATENGKINNTKFTSQGFSNYSKKYRTDLIGSPEDMRDDIVSEHHEIIDRFSDELFPYFERELSFLTINFLSSSNSRNTSETEGTGTQIQEQIIKEKVRKCLRLGYKYSAMSKVGNFLGNLITSAAQSIGLRMASDNITLLKSIIKALLKEVLNGARLCLKFNFQEEKVKRKIEDILEDINERPISI